MPRCLILRRFSTASYFCLYRLHPVTAQVVLVDVPHSVAVAELVVEDLGARPHSDAAVAASVVPVAVVLVYVPHSVAVAEFVVEDLGARAHSGAAVAASVVHAPRSAWSAAAEIELADLYLAPSEVAVALAAVSF